MRQVRGNSKTLESEDLLENAIARTEVLVHIVGRARVKIGPKKAALREEQVKKNRSIRLRPEVGQSARALLAVPLAASIGSVSSPAGKQVQVGQVSRVSVNATFPIELALMMIIFQLMCYGRTVACFGKR